MRENRLHCLFRFAGLMRVAESNYGMLPTWPLGSGELAAISDSALRWGEAGSCWSGRLPGESQAGGFKTVNKSYVSAAVSEMSLSLRRRERERREKRTASVSSQAALVFFLFNSLSFSAWRDSFRKPLAAGRY